MLILLIAGALGSGKTTLLLSLAMKFRQEGRRVGILENDAGTVPVDAPFLRDRGFAVEDIRSGCICCDLSSSLPAAVAAIRDSIDPEILLVEPSGLAAPGIVREALNGLLAGEDRIFALYLMDLLRYSEHGKPLSPFFIRAMETSDIVVTTKTQSIRPDVAVSFCNEVELNLPKKQIEDISAISCRGSGDFTDPGLTEPNHGRIKIQSVSPPSGIQCFAASYYLKWREGTDGEMACSMLAGFISDIRNRLTKTSSPGLGTVKLSTSAGEGTIISVSDGISDPTVNRQAPWIEAPEHMTVNVLGFFDRSGLDTAVREAFASIEALSVVEIS